MTTQPTLPTSPVRAIRLLAGAVVLGAAIASTACDQESSAARMVKQADAKLAAIGGGETTGRDELARRTYQEVVNDLRGVIGDAEPGDAASASLVLARAHIGLGESAAERAVGLNAELQRRVASARNELSAWIDHHAEASSLEAFDPANELASLADQRAQLEALLGEGERDLGELKTAYEGLKAQGAGASQSAEGFRSQALTIEQQIAQASATQGAQLAPRLRELRRQGDAFEREAGDLIAQAEIMEPQIANIERQLTTLRTQIGGLDQRRVSLNEQAASVQQAARDERAAADQAVDRFEAALGAIASLRADKLEPAIGEAMQAFNAAIQSAGRARSGLRDDASRTQGAARRRLGDTLTVRALGVDTLARLLETAAAVSPPPPSAESYRRQAAELRETQTESLTEAAEAFESASSELAAGADSELSDRLDRVMQYRARVARGAAVDLDAVKRLAQAPPAGGDPFANGPEPTLQSLVDQLAASADEPMAGGLGMVARLTELMRFEQAELDQALGELGRAARSLAELDGAATDAYGEGLITLASNNQQLQQFSGGAIGGLSELESESGPTITMNDFVIVNNGDSADVTLINPETGDSLEFVMRADLVEGGWYIDLTQFVADDGASVDLSALQSNPQLAQVPASVPVATISAYTPLIGKAADLFETTTSQVRDGAHADGQTMMNNMVLGFGPIFFEAAALGQQQGQTPGDGGTN